MKRVQDRGRVLEVVVDGVLVAVEQLQGGDLDPLAERLTALVEPVAVDLPRPAGHQVEQPGPDPSGLVTGLINHPGRHLRPRPPASTGLVET